MGQLFNCILILFVLRKEFGTEITMAPYEALVLRCNRPESRGAAARLAGVWVGWVALVYMVKMWI